MSEDIILVYLAGPLRGTWSEKRRNMRQAQRMARMLWLEGIAVYSPHLNSGWLDTPKTDQFILPANIDILKRCDALFIMNGWRRSQGTKTEMRCAIDMKIPMFFNVWALVHISKRGKSGLKRYAEISYSNNLNLLGDTL